MGAATTAVVLSPHTHPAALLLLSAGVVSAGLVGWAVFRSLSGFLGLKTGGVARPLDEQTATALEREKALVLRAIKELEFDYAMGKVSEADFKEIGGRLRLRALVLMQELERAPARPAAGVPAAPPAATAATSADARPACASCGTNNDHDAKFCKSCGARL
jgi:hypothetical protein